MMSIRLLELRSGLGPEPTPSQLTCRPFLNTCFRTCSSGPGICVTALHLRRRHWGRHARHAQDLRQDAIGNEIDRGLRSLMSDIESRDFLRGLIAKHSRAKRPKSSRGSIPSALSAKAMAACSANSSARASAPCYRMGCRLYGDDRARAGL